MKSFLFPKKEMSPDSLDEGLSGYLTQEKLLVFAISFVLAFCLWFIVNLSRDFNINMDLPLEVGNIPDDMALVSDLPEYATVSVNGEGWKLISLYNNPPRISVDVSEQEVNLFERVQQQMTASSDVNVTKVQPLVLNLTLEEKAVKKVPVEARIDVRTREQFGMISEPVLEPDSVTLCGASTKLQEIDRLLTRETVLEDVTSGRTIELQLERPGSGVTIDPQSVRISFDIAEFTEGEVRIPIRIRNLPPGRAVTYNPSSVTVKYDVPIEQYRDVQNIRPFTAYVDYVTLEADTTGFVVPQIERITDQYDVRLRSFQPRTVSYFNVVQDN